MNRPICTCTCTCDLGTCTRTCSSCTCTCDWVLVLVLVLAVLVIVLVLLGTWDKSVECIVTKYAPKSSNKWLLITNFERTRTLYNLQSSMCNVGYKTERKWNENLGSQLRFKYSDFTPYRYSPTLHGSSCREPVPEVLSWPDWIWWHRWTGWCRCRGMRWRVARSRRYQVTSCQPRRWTSGWIRPRAARKLRRMRWRRS